MVGAIANQTMQGDSVANAREAFAARLMTLSRAHDLLTQSSWASAPIRDVVEGALAAHRTGRGQISVGGPDLHLTAKQALALAVAIHELATNATKYGALSGRRQRRRGVVRPSRSAAPKPSASPGPRAAAPR